MSTGFIVNVIFLGRIVPIVCNSVVKGTWKYFILRSVIEVVVFL